MSESLRAEAIAYVDYLIRVGGIREEDLNSIELLEFSGDMPPEVQHSHAE